MKNIKRFFTIALAIMVMCAMSVTAFGFSSENNAQLSRMSVKQVLSDGTEKDVEITPAFSPQVTEYSANLDKDCVELKFDFATGSPLASAESYYTNIDPGNNTSGVKVTASDGTVMDYKLSSVRPDSGETTTAEDATTAEGETTSAANVQASDITVKYGSDTYKLVSADQINKLPAGFAVADYTYENQTVKAIKSTDGSVVGMYLQGNDNKTALYTYDENSKAFSPAVTLPINKEKVLVFSKSKQDDLPNGYEAQKIQIKNKDVQAYSLGNGSSFYLVNGVDSNGSCKLYSYNAEDDSLQLFNQVDFGKSTVNHTTQDQNTASGTDNSRRNLIIIIVIAALLLICIFIILNLVLKLKERSYEDYDDEPEDEDDYKDAYDDEPEETVSKREEKERRKLEKKAEKARKKQEKLKKKKKYDDDDSFDDGYGDDDEDFAGAFQDQGSKEKPADEKEDESDDDDLDITFESGDTTSIPDITPEMIRQAKMRQKENEVIDSIPEVTTDHTSTAEESSLAKSIQKVMAEDSHAKEAAPVVEKETKKAPEKSKEDESQNTKIYNVDMEDSILEELNQKSKKLDKEAESVDNLIPKFDTADIPTMSNLDIDLSGLTDDDEDDFEFFDFDQPKDKK